MPNPSPELNAATTAILVSAVDSMVLAAVRHGALQRNDAAANRRKLKEKARLLRDFEHFRRLCLGDLRQAWIEDRQEKTRNARNRRLTWLALYRHYAACCGETRRLKIVALGRQGNYVCELVDPQPDDGWDKLVNQAQAFGISEQDLMTLLETKQRRAA